MAKIVSVHSFRGGTGKSNTTANIAALLAADGYRVGVVDTDIQSPGIHILFGLHGDDIGRSLNDYLWGRCPIAEAAIDVTPRLGDHTGGRLFLIPSSMQAHEIARVLREGYDAHVLTGGLRRLIKELELDILLIDTHPGLNEETLLSIALSHALLVIMRPDQQDYEGTGVTVEVANALNVPHMLLLVNKVPPIFDLNAVHAEVAQAFNCRIAAVIPHCDEMMALASSDLFALKYPDHAVTGLLKQTAALLSPKEAADARAS